jgi:glutathione S-transferase
MNREKADMAGDRDAGSVVEMWQFRLSMFPEKARWALDYKEIPHVRHSLLPGPHVPQMLMKCGQKQLPVLTHRGIMIKGSAAVIDYVEREFPGKPLYPNDPAQRRQALEIQQQFDELGPHVRRAFFWQFLPETRYAADLFSVGYPPLARRAYRAAFPGIRPVMQMDMHITRAGAEEGCRRTREALDFVEQQRGPDGYLVGKQFSIADLTAAVVLNSVVLPEEFIAFPTPRPAGVEQWLARWEKHPATAWVREMYRKHRGRSCAIEDRNG